MLHQTCKFPSPLKFQHFFKIVACYANSNQAFDVSMSTIFIEFEDKESGTFRMFAVR
ncbi:hypothetical protein X737_38535 [Mesorhizobium sp. L48C026A00]|nr:hypothetical protein X737_38535 [Mesorhizobium sp. L48C026A00]